MPRRGLECIAVSVLTDWKDSPSEDSLNSYDDHHHHPEIIISHHHPGQLRRPSLNLSSCAADAADQHLITCFSRNLLFSLWP